VDSTRCPLGTVDPLKCDAAFPPRPDAGMAELPDRRHSGRHVRAAAGGEAVVPLPPVVRSMFGEAERPVATVSARLPVAKYARCLGELSRGKRLCGLPLPRTSGPTRRRRGSGGSSLPKHSAPCSPSRPVPVARSRDRRPDRFDDAETATLRLGTRRRLRGRTARLARRLILYVLAWIGAGRVCARGCADELSRCRAGWL
jgi:hypothetical protein